jgi:LacI family transcriptional regulator
MATMKDVAKRAGVSVSTVSYVINETKNISDAVRVQVLQAIDDLKYRPNKTAQNLARSKTRSIGLFTYELESMRGNLFLNDLVSGILSVISKRQYNLIVYGEGRDADGNVSISLNHGEPIDGAIIINPRAACTYLNPLIERQMSFVLIGRPDGIAEPVNYVDVDNVAIAYHATMELLEHNHSRILFLNGPTDYTISIDRLEGYRMALEAHHVAFREDLVKNSEFSIQSGFQRTSEAYANGSDVTGIIANSDTLAIGSVNALIEKGLRIPRDVSLVCAGESAFTTYFSPKITGIDLHPVEVAARAAQQILALFDRKLIKPSHSIVPFTMNRRESVANGRAKGGD